MAKDRFQKGTTVNCRVTFTDPDNADTVVDPTSVTFKYQSPDLTVTSYVFGTDAQVVKESVGKYLVRLLLDQEGTFRYRWVAATSTGGTVFNDSVDSEQQVDF